MVKSRRAVGLGVLVVLSLVCAGCCHRPVYGGHRYHKMQRYATLAEPCASASTLSPSLPAVVYSPGVYTTPPVVTSPAAAAPVVAPPAAVLPKPSTPADDPKTPAKKGL